jgi:hypothetical protein
VIGVHCQNRCKPTDDVGRMYNLTTKIITLLEFFNLIVSEVSHLQYGVIK